MSREVEDETTVNESFSVTVPAAVRRAAGVEAGDKLRWAVDEEGSLSVELVKQRYGAFSDLDPVDVSEATDAADEPASVHNFVSLSMIVNPTAEVYPPKNEKNESQ